MQRPQFLPRFQLISNPKSRFDLGPWLAELNQVTLRHEMDGGAEHEGKGVDEPTVITIEVVGAANANWDVAGVLLLWRGEELVVAAVDPPAPSERFVWEWNVFGTSKYSSWHLFDAA